MLCGQHALNNLVQAYEFSAASLAEIAHQLDEMELTYMAQNNEGGIQYVNQRFDLLETCFSSRLIFVTIIVFLIGQF